MVHDQGGWRDSWVGSVEWGVMWGWVGAGSDFLVMGYDILAYRWELTIDDDGDEGLVDRDDDDGKGSIRRISRELDAESAVQMRYHDQLDCYHVLVSFRREKNDKRQSGICILGLRSNYPQPKPRK